MVVFFFGPPRRPLSNATVTASGNSSPCERVHRRVGTTAGTLQRRRRRGEQQHVVSGLRQSASTTRCEKASDHAKQLRLGPTELNQRHPIDCEVMKLSSILFRDRRHQNGESSHFVPTKRDRSKSLCVPHSVTPLIRIEACSEDGLTAPSISRRRTSVGV